MKKQNIFTRMWDYVTFPFIGIAILIDEDRRLNEDGRWDNYWKRQIKRGARRAKRAAKRQARKEKNNR